MSWLRAEDGSRRSVAVSAHGGRLVVSVGDERFDPQVTTLGAGRFALSGEDRTRTFHCVRQGDELHLFWEGRVYRLTDEGEGRPATAGHASGALEAPMPGRVIKLSVEPGQDIQKGQEILVVEAMKMENSLKAPRAGRVSAIHTRVGDLVTPGLVLVEIAEA